LGRTDLVEIWRAEGRVTSGTIGPIRYSSDDRYLIGVLELDEREVGSIRVAAQAAYAAIGEFQSNSPFPHMLRMWNYFDAINDGEHDEERYRQFCLGRALGMGDTRGQYPAASALGRQHTTHQLQVYWLASRVAGTPIENPRQVSAYRYPREHGPASPSFARAAIAPDGMLLISGTASIVGHASQHCGDPLAQLDETLRNLESVATQNACNGVLSGLLKVYVRDSQNLQAIRKRLQELAPQSDAIFLAADVCRRELLLEIECVARN
jgi:chorismate lyase/3-hydroxybenzoate synthase